MSALVKQTGYLKLIDHTSHLDEVEYDNIYEYENEYDKIADVSAEINALYTSIYIVCLEIYK